MTYILALVEYEDGTFEKVRLDEIQGFFKKEQENEVMRKPTQKELNDYFTDTHDHINRVRRHMNEVVSNLTKRAAFHDQSKFNENERDIYAVVTPEFSKYEYGTPEHKAVGDKLGPAWRHHLKNNDHHPRHHQNGMWDMDLMMVIEMLCDWKAASERNPNQNFEDSLSLNIRKYGIDGLLASAIVNTAKSLGFIDRNF